MSQTSQTSQPSHSHSQCGTPPLYKDLGKKSRDLLSKNFPDSFDLELNTKGPVSFKLTSAQRAGSSSFDIEASHECLAPGLQLPSKVVVFADSGEKYYLDAQIQNLFHPGTKFNFRTTSKKQALEHKLSSEYKRNMLTFTSALTVAGKKSVASSVVLGGAQGFVAGAEDDFSIDAKEISSGSLAVGYHSNDFEAFAFSKMSKTRQYTLSFWGKVPQCGSCHFASEFNYDAAAKGQARFAFEKKLADGLTGKIRWDTKNKAALSLKAQVNPAVEVTFGEEVDFENGNVAKVGISLTFK